MRVDIKQWGTTLVRKNLPALPKVQEFLTSVGCFHMFIRKICYKLSENFGTKPAKKFSYLHENVVTYVCTCKIYV